MPDRRSRALLGAACAACALLVVAASGQAPVSPRMDVSVQVQREVIRTDARGRTVTALEPVARAQPGDVLVYTLAAANVGLAPARAAHVDDPIPAGTVLIPESVTTGGRPVTASLDGGKTWQAFPARVARTRADGAVEQVAAPAAAYTHLRWELPDPMAPGASAAVGYKVRVR